MNSYVTEAAALLAALWLPYFLKIILADIAIGAMILSGYVWLRHAEGCISTPTEFRWTDRRPGRS
ncbi:hypothetical protein LMIY3S_03742 [Labrys miyagiensis]